MENEKDKTALGIDENIEAILCYVLGWITGIVFLVLEKENRFVRFHALQSLAAFLPIFVIWVIVGMIPFIGGFLSVVILIFSLILWLFLMFKAFKGEKFKLPWAGDFADQQSSR